MSTPARNLPTPNRVPSTPSRTRAEPVRRHGHEMPEPAPAPSPKRRKRHHLGFAVFASTVIGLMVLGVVVLNVLLAQQSFRIDEAERRLEVLDRDHLELVSAQATLSAPGRIASWASRHGMRLPDDIRILRAPNGPSDPAGADTSMGAEG